MRLHTFKVYIIISIKSAIVFHTIRTKCYTCVKHGTLRLWPKTFPFLTQGGAINMQNLYLINGCTDLYGLLGTSSSYTSLSKNYWSDEPPKDRHHSSTGCTTCTPSCRDSSWTTESTSSSRTERRPLTGPSC